MAIPHSSNVNLNWDYVNSVEEVVAIHKALCGTLQTAREIDNKIQEWGNKLENRRALTEAVADAIALNDSKEVKSCIHRAVTPAHQLLQAMADTTRMLTNLNLAKTNSDSLSLMMKFAWEIAEKVKLVKSNSSRVAALLHNAVRASNACRRRLGTRTFSSRKLNDCALAIRSNANADAVFNAMNVLLRHVEDALYQALIHSNNLPLHSHSHSHCIANMVAFLREHGRARKCVKIYWDIRVKVLIMNFLDTLVRESSSSGGGVVHAAEWRHVEAVVNEWIRGLRLLVCEFLHREKTAAHMLFQGFDRGMWLQAFAHALVSRSHHHDLDFIIGTHLLVSEFEQAVASSRLEPTRLFKLLDMFEHILDVDEQLHNNIFEGRDYCKDFRLRLGIAQLQTSLASACINTLACFVKKIEEETSLPSDGGVLTITSSTVDYVRFLVGRYESAVKKVLEMRGQGLDLRKAVVKILEALEKNIEEQQRAAAAAKGHGHLFLMNNYWYILKRCRDNSELALVLGDTWLKERGRWVNQNAAAYHKHQWAPLIRHLNRPALAPGSNSNRNSKGPAKKLFKQRLTLFNAHFEKVYQQHSQWTVTDKELRDATLVNVTQLLVPAYTNFVNTYARLLHSSKHVAKYIKYTPEKIEEILVDLFTHDSRSLANFGCNQI